MITPTHTQSPEWQNENALRYYPLDDDAPAGAILPTWLLSDLRITVDTSYDAVFLSSAYVSDTVVSVGISGRRGTEKPEGLLTRTVTRDELEPFRAYSMDRMSGIANGLVSFGEPPADAAPFKATFSEEEAPLSASAVIRAKVPGVTRIVDREHGTYASGIIDLSGNSEFRTRLGDDNTIIISLSDIYRDLSTSVCRAYPSFKACGETPIKTINGVEPFTEGLEAGTIKLRFR